MGQWLDHREKGRRALSVVALVIVAPLLVACGGDDDPGTPTPVDPAQVQTLGEIADRIEAAWPDVETYQSLFTTDVHVALEATPGADVPESLEVFEAVVVPDRRHRVFRAGGEVTDEFLAIEGRVFARGDFVQRFVDPSVERTAWIELDREEIPADSQLGFLVGELVAPAEAPYAGIPDELRAREVTPGDEITVGDRVCQTYETVNATEQPQNDERIEVTLSLDADDRLCTEEIRAGDTVNYTTYTYNEPLTIDPPLLATPVPISATPVE